MMARDIRNVIFDLGGVVLGRDFELAGDGELPFAFLRGDRPFPQFWKDFDRGVATQSEVAEAISRAEGLTVADADRMVTRLGYMFNEFPDTVELIRELHASGYRLYVLSNMPGEFWTRMRELEVFTHFDGIVISSAEKMTKPDPALFRLLLERYGLDADQTLFVDDKPSNTAAAAALGMHVCVFEPSGGPDAVRLILNGK